MDDEERKLIETTELNDIKSDLLDIKNQEDNIIQNKEQKKWGIKPKEKKQTNEPKSNTINRLPPNTKKDDLRRCIVDMCRELGEPIPKSTFFRKPKAILEDKVKELTKLMEKKVIDIKMDEVRKKELISNPEKNPSAVALYGIQYTISRFVESASIAFKSKTFDIAVLEGLCRKIDDNKDEFLSIFAAIAFEHDEVISKYLTPGTRYLLLMTRVAGTVVTENIAKKKLQSKQESKDLQDDTN